MDTKGGRHHIGRVLFTHHILMFYHTLENIFALFANDCFAAVVNHTLVFEHRLHRVHIQSTSIVGL